MQQNHPVEQDGQSRSSKSACAGHYNNNANIIRDNAAIASQPAHQPKPLHPNKPSLDASFHSPQRLNDRQVFHDYLTLNLPVQSFCKPPPSNQVEPVLACQPLSENSSVCTSPPRLQQPQLQYRVCHPSCSARLQCQHSPRSDPQPPKHSSSIANTPELPTKKLLPKASGSALLQNLRKLLLARQNQANTVQSRQQTRPMESDQVARPVQLLARQAPQDRSTASELLLESQEHESLRQPSLPEQYQMQRERFQFLETQFKPVRSAFQVRPMQPELFSQASQDEAQAESQQVAAALVAPTNEQLPARLPDETQLQASDLWNLSSRAFSPTTKTIVPPNALQLTEPTSLPMLENVCTMTATRENTDPSCATIPATPYE